MRLDRIIVIGAAGMAGTPRCDRWMSRFGASLVVDNWNGAEALPARALVLTDYECIVPPAHSCVMTYDAATSMAAGQVRIG